MGNIVERIEVIKSLFKENVRSDATPFGLLRGDEVKYLECLEIKK